VGATLNTKKYIQSAVSFSGKSLFASVTSVALTPALFAAPPIAFDDWNESAGVISANCPVNHICNDSVNDAGVIQRTVETPSGDSYIQFILFDQDADGTVFRNESFVGASLNVKNGISTKQVIDKATVGDQLTSTAIINTGWANEPGVAPAIQLSQVQTMTFQNVDYTSSFSYEADEDASGVRTGDYLDITQRLVGSGSITGPVTTGTDIQKFVTRRATGSRVPSAGSLTLPNLGGGGFGGGGAQSAAGGTTTWQANDEIKVTWVGQLCDQCVGQGGQIATTNFSFQSFDNLVDAADPITTISRAATDPFTWDPVLGIQPILD